MTKLRIAACSLTAVAPAAYLGVIRPWHLQWGATPAEARRDFPGDELLRHPMIELTRAVTIAAAPAQVWPWLVQLGAGRAGFYSYDRLDNRGKPSADRIIPEFQHLAVGDRVPLSEDVALTVRLLEPERTLVLHAPQVEAGWVRAAVSWALTLAPAGEDTRMAYRMRVDIGPGVIGRMYAVYFELADFIMMRRHMLGIKQRAERLAARSRTARPGRAPAASRGPATSVP